MNFEDSFMRPSDDTQHFMNKEYVRLPGRRFYLNRSQIINIAYKFVHVGDVICTVYVVLVDHRLDGSTDVVTSERKEIE